MLAALLSCGVPAVVIVTFRDSGPGAAANASPIPIHSPKPGDPEQVSQLWLRERIAEVLTQQAGRCFAATSGASSRWLSRSRRRWARCAGSSGRSAH
ncbi:hypothetical protein Pflav_065680 [Phytohabitans flavus]|uniref:Uncharacterized protein n=1 Tax=Phytohabitans flavus TaxID=1076124 RepID=A0A6F8Y2F0_9ACTN|nr:hypothetical protein Pflav_065680 [Phytohabitans flavus]